MPTESCVTAHKYEHFLQDVFDIQVTSNSFNNLEFGASFPTNATSETLLWHCSWHIVLQLLHKHSFVDLASIIEFWSLSCTFPKNMSSGKLITACIHLCVLLSRDWMCPWGTTFHSSRAAAIRSSSLVLGTRFLRRTRRFSWSHLCSIGFKSGLYTGQSNAVQLQFPRL